MSHVLLVFLYIPHKALLNIYKTLIEPHLLYGICSWGNSAKTYLNRLLVLQKRALRLINFSNSRDHAIPFFIQTKSLPLNFLYFERMSIMMHDIYNNITPQNLNNLFKSSANIHQYKTRSTTNKCFYIESVRTELMRNSFKSTGTKIWNSIPLPLKI